MYVNKDIEFEYGDIIYFVGNFEKASSSKNFKGFDYSRYLRQNKKKVGKEKDFLYYLELFKKKLKRNLFSVFDKEKSGFLLGLLLGDKTELLDETASDFRNSSLSHILAISGLHIVYVSFGIRFLLDFITSRQRLKNFLMIFFLIFFSILTGGSPSCLRACIMSSMVFLSKVLYRKNDFLTSFLISLDIILIINCYNIESIGMWLSFLATFGLVYINFKKSDFFSQKNLIVKIKDKILDNFKTSLSCNLMIIPIIWNSYNNFSLTFFISNLFASFLIGPIIVLGYIHLFLGKFSKIFSFVENFLLNILFEVAEKIGNFRFSKIFVPSIPICFWVIYYILIFLLIYSFNHKDILKKLFFYFKQKLKYCIYIFLLLSIFLFLIFYEEKNLELHFLDVGQGDCSLIVTPFNKTILIDGGNNEGFDNGESVVAPYLLKNGITKIDYVIISHR